MCHACPAFYFKSKRIKGEPLLGHPELGVDLFQSYDCKNTGMEISLQ